jgi:hypothetical protein
MKLQVIYRVNKLNPIIDYPAAPYLRSKRINSTTMPNCFGNKKITPLKERGYCM